MSLFSFDTNTWTPISPQVTWPPAVFYASAVTLGFDKFVLHGGSRDDQDVSNDTYVFYADTLQWYKLITRDTALVNATGVSTAFSPVTGALYRYGGEGEISLVERMFSMVVGCNPGHYTSDFVNDACYPCPIGHFSGVPGSAACDISCPQGTTTVGMASTSVDDCKVCASGSCQNGKCTVQGRAPICECDTGYHGQQCNEPTLWIVLAVLLGTCLLAVIALLVYKRLKKSLGYYRTRSSMHEKLLGETQMQLEELERVWLIEAKDVAFVKCIGQGTYGEVRLTNFLFDVIFFFF